METELTIINGRNESVTFKTDIVDGLKLIDIEMGVSADIQTVEAPYQDGSGYIDTLLEPQPISIEFLILEKDTKNLQDFRRKVNRVINPKLGLSEIRYTTDAGTWVINGIAEMLPDFPTGNDNRGEGYQRGMIDFICPDPYWRDIQETSRALQAYVGTFTMPFSFPVQFGTQGDSIIINNEGDTSAPVQVSMQGPLDRPMLENKTTGEYMRLNTNIHTDEILFIDTTFNSKRVEIYYGNQIIKAMGYFDHNGDFMQLTPGENELRYTAYSGVRDSVASITWANRYVGI